MRQSKRMVIAITIVLLSNTAFYVWLHFYADSKMGIKIAALFSTQIIIVAAILIGRNKES